MRRDQKYTAFLDLHQGNKAFVMPNPWDAGSARVLAAEGFAALATTSAGAAVTQGLRDGAASMTRAAILSNAAEIVAATDLPVSADLEDGFGLAPETCAKTIVMAAEVGLVGGSIEDATGGEDAGVMDMGLAVERIAAAAEAAKAHQFVLTARAENYLHGRPDLKDTIARLQAFEAAGADVLYAPGLPDLDAIRTVCAEVSKPVNVVMGLRAPFYTVQELSEVGVARISVGGSLARLAYGAVQQAMRAVLQDGAFAYADKAMPGAELMGLMRAQPTPRV
ncbi:isocitrate lyase/PEP mutase family protein [Shimia sp.]|jgi:2-methylisocitrate lyase-like PEP mutase family enzyme|uniref:isocitrate lyase/PEP mutase family protein n=1 Tax=unclassified Shimia TaxID=2630038 RepID=UPI002600C8AC|nr:isocitrate lyase/phosphoenolpyruvate mutase family protein [Shimia sp.]MCH2065894.1 isocitrate lyase/phosphoenolpyruvate mutase family protein [Shimia sp.]